MNRFCAALKAVDFLHCCDPEQERSVGEESMHFMLPKCMDPSFAQTSASSDKVMLTMTTEN